ncbi:MAG: T9SS type A sorting domain-containing protein [Ignavibacteria bacterium]|nr:T9SS type A sorting domain-containing protein [Ignavibacteria bacterium]
MKKILVLLILMYAGSSFAQWYPFHWVRIKGNYACTFIGSSGVFNKDFRYTNTPGYTVPCGSTPFCENTGLSAACKIDGALAMFACTYTGELIPGYILNGVAYTNDDFKIYLVKKVDNEFNNPDYANWYKMTGYGAPFIDVNNNCIFEPGIDKPGMQDASETAFVCYTDGFSQYRSNGEGFGGGIKNPLLNAEVRFTMWAYSETPMQFAYFFRYQIINKGNKNWDSVYFALFSDPSEFTFYEEFLGCDTNRHLAYAYGDENIDYIFGIKVLKGAVNKLTGDTIYLSSFVWERFNYGCEWEVPGNPQGAYYYMKGFKSDGTSHLDPTKPLGGNKYEKTKFILSGDPETNAGWTPSKGRIANCGGTDTGTIVPLPPSSANMVMGMGADNFTIAPGDTQVIVYCQTVDRGNSNVNSVTKLKSQTDAIYKIYNAAIKYYAENFCYREYIIYPDDFSLEQNYPNPYNNKTVIKFSIPRVADIKIEVFDLLGRSVFVPVNGEYKPGYYELTINAEDLASGIYYYRMQVVDKTVSSQVKYGRILKMALVK